MMEIAMEFLAVIAALLIAPIVVFILLLILYRSCIAYEDQGKVCCS